MFSLIKFKKKEFDKKFFFLKNIDFFFLNIFKSLWNNSKKNNFNNKILVEVDLLSNKVDIRNSIEIIFNIKVISVNTLIKKNIYKRNRYNYSLSNKKKAFINFRWF